MKILALVNAHALAHVSRALQVAKELRNHGHQIVFAGEGKYHEVLRQDDFQWIELPFVPLDQMLQAIRSGRMDKLFNEDQLLDYIHAELDLYEQLKPDLILIDNRLTATTSAEIAKIKTVSILNVHMSLYRSIPFFSLRNLTNSKGGPVTSIIDRIENKIEFTLYDKIVVKSLQRIRKKLGLTKRSGMALEEGDLTLLPDIPDFNPTNALPKDIHYVGPLIWKNKLPAPECLKKLDPQKHTVYVSLGSQGLDQLLNQLCSFNWKNIQMIISTGKETPDDQLNHNPNIFIEKYVNVDLVLPYCDLAICHGGNGTIYQILKYGIPIIGVSSHAEQDYGLKRIKQMGLGAGFQFKHLKFENLKNSIYKVLEDQTYRERAHEFSKTIRSCNSEKLAAKLIEDFYDEKNATL